MIQTSSAMITTPTVATPSPSMMLLTSAVRTGPSDSASSYFASVHCAWLRITVAKLCSTNSTPPVARSWLIGAAESSGAMTSQ